jgi:hypothetical protein
MSIDAMIRGPAAQCMEHGECFGGGCIYTRPSAKAGHEADERAHRLASIAAETLLRSEGESTAMPDEYAVPLCQVDDYLADCVAHLVWHGQAVSHETADGYLLVQLGDFTIGA